MNVTELARKLKVKTEDLLDKLPELGFDIGKKAIKVDDRLAQRIIKAWGRYHFLERQKKQYLEAKDKAKKQAQEKLAGGKIEIPAVLTVKELSEILHLPVVQVISTLMENGVIASMNQRIDFDTAAIVAQELGFSAEQKEDDEEEQIVSQTEKMQAILEKETEKVGRAPVVVVLGHVDHGKTKLLDAIRKTNIVDQEAGGITQSIGAYQVVVPSSSSKQGDPSASASLRSATAQDDSAQTRTVTFIDTPGHEAFTAMRSRGAQVADIAILIVAVDDGVKPQTVEALKIAESASLPIIVALNKIDKPGANIEKTKQELSKYNLNPEDWGGKTMMIPISAKQEENIEELLDSVLLVAEMEQEKITANPDGQALAYVIESHIDKNAGPVATLLVKNGTFNLADILHVDNVYYGKVRAMKDWQGNDLQSAGPSVPAQVLGFKMAPKVGDIVGLAEDRRDLEKVKVKKIIEQEKSVVAPEAKEEDESVTKINLILRADVLGSAEAIVESLKKLETPELKIKIIQQGLGNITENDLELAETSGAMLFGFNVHLSPRAKELLQSKKIDVRLHKIIYDLINDVKEKINELIKPELVRKDLGKMQIVAIFRKEQHSMIVGGKVTEGEIKPNTRAAVLRDGEFITVGQVTQLQSAKQEVSNCVKGQECGILFKGQPVIEEGDVLEVYKEEQVKKAI